MKNLYLKHGLVSRTYSKKSLIMASIFGSKSKFFMIMSPFILSARLTTPPAANSAIRTSTNFGKSLRTSPSTTMKAEMKQKNSSNRSRPFLHLKASGKHLTGDLLELEDQINFLLKGSRPTPTSSSAHTPQAYVNAVHPNSRLRNQNKPPKLNTFAFRERTGLSPQPQALGTTFEARLRDYMAAHTERMKRFENAIFKQREEINEKGNNKTNETPDNTKMPTEMEMPVMKAEVMIGAENRTEKKSIKTPENEEAVEAPGSQPVAYYL
ncbi:hypothetical protein Tco_0069438 [Tanacetum coccineum]